MSSKVWIALVLALGGAFITFRLLKAKYGVKEDIAPPEHIMVNSICDERLDPYEVKELSVQARCTLKGCPEDEPCCNSCGVTVVGSLMISVNDGDLYRDCQFDGCGKVITEEECKPQTIKELRRLKGCD